MAFGVYAATVLGVSIVAMFIWIFTHATPGSQLDQQQIHQITQDAMASRPFMIYMDAAVLLVTLGISLTAAAISPQPILSRLALSRSRSRWFALPLIVLGAMAASMVMGLIIQAFHGNDSGSLKIIRALFEGLRGWPLMGMVALVAVGAGVAEELFFRGYIQSRLLKRIRPFWAILISSALFAIAHFDVAHSSFALGFGLYLGWVAWTFDSIRPTIACHVVNNTVAVLSGAFHDPTEHITGGPPLLIWVIACVVTLLACMLVTPRMRRL